MPFLESFLEKKNSESVCISICVHYKNIICSFSFPAFLVLQVFSVYLMQYLLVVSYKMPSLNH